MKKLICLLLILLPLKQAFAQLSSYDFDQYEFEEDADYLAAETDALNVANLLLAAPFDENAPLREDAIYFLVAWVEGTPDYVFGTGRTKIILPDKVQYMGIWYAAQVKYALENQKSVKGDNEAILDVWETIAAYFSNPGNHAELTPKLKELVMAYNSHQLEPFIARHK